MRVLWVCNIMLPVIAQALQRECSNKEGWLTGLMGALLAAAAPPVSRDSKASAGSQIPEGTLVPLELGVAFPIGPKEKLLKGDAYGVRYYGFPENTGKPEVYNSRLERDMQEILQDFQPDILHCFGTEHPHTLAAMRAYNRPQSSLVSIQGLCTVCAEAYMANIPLRLRGITTFRDWVKRDNMPRQQEKFRRRGKWEQEAVRLAGHVAGRTDWDRYWTTKWNPQVKYHLLQETLR
ncbi:MAG: glycosyl transferase 4, partial [Acetatifactor sp.]|nr:glycosyl transferase 4 [Acetatifactor sp.]